MRTKHIAGAVAATAVVFGMGGVAPASATSNLQLFGVQETLKDVNGPLIGYTVTGLMPTSDPVPYPFAGRPYEATVKADALVGTVTPFASYFNARAENGDNYRVLANVSNLGGPIGQGGSNSGKVYFDVVGAEPNSVVFNNGAEDILGWVQPPGVSSAEVAPPASGGGESSGGGSGGNESGGGESTGGGSTGPNQATPNTTAGESGNSSADAGDDSGSG